jgi:hypothetical protein
MIVGQALNGRDVTSLEVSYLGNTGTLCFTVN